MPPAADLTGPTLPVTVVWATPDVQAIVPLALPPGTTLGQAVARSGLVERHGLDRDLLAFGIHGRLAAAETVLAAGDRVEIYRALAIDPKEARRLRAAAKARRKG